MPTYLCHGFRWYRNNIRVFAQFQDIEDAAPDWVIRRGSSHALIYTLYTIFDFLPFAEDLAAVAGEASARRLNKKRSRARFLNRLGMFNSSSSSASAAAAASPLSSSAAAAYGDFSDDDPLPPPTPLPQPPVIPKILLPPGSETIVLPPGIKPPSMQRAQPVAQEAKARVVRRDAADPVLCNNDWAAIRLLEEWDEHAEPTAEPHGRWCTRPWAYVADYAVRIDLSGRVGAEMARYERWAARLDDGTHRPMGDALEDDPAAERAAVEAGVAGKKSAAAKKRGWFQKLRDNMEPEGAIQWYIVVCDDEVRGFPVDEEEEDEGVEVEEQQQQQQQQQQKEEEKKGDKGKEKEVTEKMAAVNLAHTRGTGSSATHEYDTEAESHDGSALIAAAASTEGMQHC
ncbi:hypothetical protein TD95_001474 [Thielaviopsis punctulata]|uniref:Uncharacterized protein n=1 Tax=Thielaviopsis punctulata TaxID=72032 RepID=A0A0F4ZI72_9PEZI|nr:hypothetical protein TD95_001474 [Thielaviopsis punctulata]